MAEVSTRSSYPLSSRKPQLLDPSDPALDEDKGAQMGLLKGQLQNPCFASFLDLPTHLQFLRERFHGKGSSSLQ